MKNGAFSMSLNVKNINKSKEFYQNMGFVAFAGNEAEKWLIMKNDSTVIGLFEGMLASNVMTFNPGWDQNAATLQQFTDIREIKETLAHKNIKIENESESLSEKTGPASFMITDPDGNIILFDQHI